MEQENYFYKKKEMVFQENETDNGLTITHQKKKNNANPGMSVHSRGLWGSGLKDGSWKNATFKR